MELFSTTPLADSVRWATGSVSWLRWKSRLVDRYSRGRRQFASLGLVSDNLLGTKFSHYPLKPQFQQADVILKTPTDTAIDWNMPWRWTSTDEWYVFFTQPKGIKVLCHIDGDKIIPNGNMLWINDKNFGMGKYQPMTWYRSVGTAKLFTPSWATRKRSGPNPNLSVCWRMLLSGQ